MPSLLDGFLFEGIYCYRDEKEPTSFYCLPQAPGPERDPAGHPVFSMLVSDTYGLLQVSMRWDLDRTKLVDLRNALAEKYSLLNPEIIQLSIPAVSVKEVRLEMGDGNGNYTLLQAGQSSGYPPFSTVFHIQLTEEQKATVMAALNGRENVLVGRYVYSLPGEASITARISGDISNLLTGLEDRQEINPSLLLDEAITDGTLVFSQHETAPVSDDLKVEVTRLVKAKAAIALEEMISAYSSPGNGFSDHLTNETMLDVSASLTQSSSTLLESMTDISTWFMGKNTTEYIHVMPSTGAQETPQQTPTKTDSEGVDLTVSVSLISKETPINFIQLIRGSSQATIRSPDFSPVTLPAAEAQEPVQIKTNFTDGGQAYEISQVPPQTMEWTLEPAQLGLALVTLDGSALAEEQVKSARVYVRYVPSGNGTEEERTLYLKNDEWISQWYVVTRNPDLGGELIYELKITTADGTIMKNPRLSTHEPHIKLTLQIPSNNH